MLLPYLRLHTKFRRSMSNRLAVIKEILQKNLTPCVSPFKVTRGTDTDRLPSAYDFLLVIHSNHGPISYRFRDKRRFLSKIANFSTVLVFNAPAEQWLK